jgi:MtrB/PioB family decaheme-associated outer membrane protein
MKRIFIPVLSLVLAGSVALARADDTVPVKPAPSPTPEPTAAPGPAKPAPAQLPGTTAKDVTSAYHEGTITLGGQATSITGDSSKFQEYREVPEGVVAPAYHLFGRSSDDLKYDFRGYTIRSDDQRYTLVGDYKSARLTADYLRMPHYFGNDGRTLFSTAGNGGFDFATGLQQKYQGVLTRIPLNTVTFNTLNALVTPDLANASSIDLKLVRARGRVDLDLTRGKPVEVRLSYFHEDRSGDRAAAGASFGFGNVTELPEPVDYVTQDMAATATMNRSWGSLRGVVRYNWFVNNVPVLSFANPFRITDSTDPNAYTAPGTSSVGGASLGRLALPPDNNAVTGSAGATFKLPGKTRLIADLSYGHWAQNSTQFIAYTTNSAIVSPIQAANINTLPAQSLDGKANVINQAYTVSSRPVKNLTLTGRVRSYNFKNETPRLTFPGYVRFDAVWEAFGRISVPYSYRNDRADLTASYDLGHVTLEAGYRYTGFHREFRETEKTTENGLMVAANLRARDGIMLRASYERAKRSFPQYLAEESEDASFTNPGAPTNLLALPLDQGGPIPGRYDQAKKATDRFNGLLQLSPNDKVSLSVSYLYALDNYNEFDPATFTANTNRYGLNRASYDSFNTDLDFTPVDRVNLYAFYGHEDNKNWERGRQSGATISLNPIDDWFSQVADKVDSWGGGAGLVLMPSKLNFNATVRYQKVNGNNDISAPVGGAAYNAKAPLGGPLGFTAYDDSRITTVTGELTYTLPRSWAVAVGGWYEDYRFDDANAATQNYLPGGYFLAANDGPYHGTVGYVRLSYRW